MRHSRSRKPTPERPTFSLVCGLCLFALGVNGAALLAQQQPWETAIGRACFEEWIADATSRLNATNGGSEFNSRKPWSFNQYGLVLGRGGYSNAAPDDWGKCGGNRYCYMWFLTEYTSGFGPRWRVWQDAEVPALRPSVEACILRRGGTIPGPGPGPGPGPTPPSGYTARGQLACYGGAQYPQSWTAQANCTSYGCNFGNLTLSACLDLGARRGARVVIHGNPGGGRDNECWLQDSCTDLRQNPAFTTYRSEGAPPPPRPTGYTERGAYACYGDATYPQAWTSDGRCGSYGCYFGKLTLDACLSLAATKGAVEVIHGNPGRGRADECWMQQSCGDLKASGDFSLFRRP